MYRIVIADDEPLTRKGLIQSMDWNKLGFEVVGDFDDGEELLDYVRNNQVDVVLSDIVMCNVGGLDIAKANVEENLGFKIILLSGYQEFEYAKQGIKYGVNAYLLKPIALQELQEEILKIKSLLDSQVLITYNEHHIFKELKEMYFCMLWIGERFDPQENAALCTLLNLKFSRYVGVSFFWDASSDMDFGEDILSNEGFAKIDCHFFSLPNIRTAMLLWNMNQTDRNTCFMRRQEMLNLLNYGHNKAFRICERSVEVVCDTEYTLNGLVPEQIFREINKLVEKWDFTTNKNFNKDNFTLTGWKVSDYSIKNIIFICKISVMLIQWRMVKFGSSYHSIRKTTDFEALHLSKNLSDVLNWLHKTLISLYRIFTEYQQESDYYDLNYIINYIKAHCKMNLQ